MSKYWLWAMLISRKSVLSLLKQWGRVSENENKEKEKKKKKIEATPLHPKLPLDTLRSNPAGCSSCHSHGFSSFVLSC